MADFYQTGVISTFHRLGPRNPDRLEAELEQLAKHRPIALVLPCLASEMDGPALGPIVDVLSGVRYLRQIVIALGRASEKDFRRAQKFFGRLPQSPEIVWNDGKPIQALYAELEEAGFNVGQDGKGRSAWLAYGYVLATGKAYVIALHDCDIINFDRDLLARLCYPVASPNLDYEYCKGFYARVADRMHGRVTRLFVTPLVRSLERIVGPQPILKFLDSFRYPLAGEFSMLADLARTVRIPPDWGLEIGLLAEVYRSTSLRRICQVDIADNYEHKHQELSPDDASKGLMKMATDIAKSLLRTLAAEGVVISDAGFRSLRIAYLRTAQDTIKRYHDDAMLNGLTFDRHAESLAIESFTEAIRIAAEEFEKDPLGAPLIPNWNRVTAALPTFLERLADSVSLDNR